MKNIAIFASGSGSNAENLILNLQKTANFSLILCNKSDAYVLNRAQKLNVPYLVFDRQQFYHSEVILNLLFENRIDLIILAGFLWLMPANIVKAFPNKIINIHPALLPKYGGKGMYGAKVHQAVVDNHEMETGISIHYVNEHYDEGQIIFQAKCLVEPSDTAEDVAQKIHLLEYEHFPKVIESFLA